MKIIRSISVNTYIDTETGKPYKVLQVDVKDTKRLLTDSLIAFNINKSDLSDEILEEIFNKLKKDIITAGRACT